nr:DUF475 domain-containing protein [Lactococcus lactis]
MVIGAIIFLVDKGTLNDLVYLDHGAHWPI